MYELFVLLRGGYKMIEVLYGIDYNRYICGGIGNTKISKVGCETVIFYKETDMLKTLTELKENHTVEIIKVFTTKINREEYKILL